MARHFLDMGLGAHLLTTGFCGARGASFAALELSFDHTTAAGEMLVASGGANGASSGREMLWAGRVWPAPVGPGRKMLLLGVSTSKI